MDTRTIAERFWEFHRANPWVYDALVKLTRDWLALGHERIGIGMLFEVLRWERGQTTVGDEFKLNNTYRSRYVRLIIRREPDLASAFETRELKAA